jgi:hypothetical protein
MLRQRKDSPRSKTRKSSLPPQRTEREVVLRLPMEPWVYRDPALGGPQAPTHDEVKGGRGCVEVDFYI